MVALLSSLSNYKRRLSYLKDPPRERWLKNTQSWINSKLPNSLSFQTAVIDGEERKCAITSTQKLREKNIHTMPGETIFAGTYVEWANSVWLITSVDEYSEVYQTGLMVQCNYNLKWVNPRGEVVSRMVIAIDGTKYLTGEYSQQFVTVGDARMQVTMPKDDETALIDRGDRFLIDDPKAEDIQAFEVTKLNRASSVYNGHGIYVHMLVESPRNDEVDNYELMIANYYDRIKKPDASKPKPIEDRIEITGLDKGFVYIGSNNSLTSSVYISGDVVDEQVTYSVDCETSVASIMLSNGQPILAVGKNGSNTGKKFVLTAVCGELETKKELTVKGWS